MLTINNLYQRSQNVLKRKYHTHRLTSSSLGTWKKTGLIHGFMLLTGAEPEVFFFFITYLLRVSEFILRSFFAWQNGQSTYVCRLSFFFFVKLLQLIR